MVLVDDKRSKKVAKGQGRAKSHKRQDSRGSDIRCEDLRFTSFSLWFVIEGPLLETKRIIKSQILKLEVILSILQNSQVAPNIYQ